MTPVTPQGALLRGNLYIILGVLAAVLTDPQVNAVLPPAVQILGRALFVGTLTYRTFIDTSHADSKNNSTTDDKAGGDP